MGVVPVRSRAAVVDDLDRFVDMHYKRLVGLLILRSGDEHRAEELAQESLVKLVKHWDRVRVMEHPWAWLATVAMNQSRSRWRRLAMMERAERRLVGTADGPSSGEDLTELLMVIHGLPERQRMALLLRHYARLSVEETAAAMECAEGTVKSLTSRAIERVRDELSEEIGDAND